MRQHLVVDADDTLWENNIYFERAFEEFCEFLAHSTLTPAEVRAVLDEIELVNIRTHGYGSANFGRNMAECYRRLVERHIAGEDLRSVLAIAERILEAPVELINGVEDTLKQLSLRHDLTLFTKGHAEEQKLKIDRSGLGIYFGHTAIVKEKDAASYRALANERGFDKSKTWMIGNSPKSDINPALEAGFNAVFVPHPHTWRLEKEEVQPRDGSRLLIIDSFRDLAWHF